MFCLVTREYRVIARFFLFCIFPIFREFAMRGPPLVFPRSRHTFFGDIMNNAPISTEKKLEEYPIGDEIWLLLVRKLKGFLEDEGKNKRPYCILLYEISPQSHVLDKVLHQYLSTAWME
jgi:hypothetical protein